MKKLLFGPFLLGFILLSGCNHRMEVTNTADYFPPPSPPLAKSIKLGVTSGSVTYAYNSRYVDAIVDALKKFDKFERVLYPFNQAVDQGQADAVVDIAVNPKYDGTGQNFILSWPGFIICSPAIWGYKYTADIGTLVSVTNLKDNTSKQIAIPTHYEFRHADIKRTWTEAGGWLLWSVPAFIGGIVFTGYDNDLTPEFITDVSPNYGAYVSNKIIEALQYGNSP